MLVKYTVYLPDGQQKNGDAEFPVDDGSTPPDDEHSIIGWDAIQTVFRQYVTDDVPERVRVWHEGKYTDMFVGERSAITDLPRNEAATAIYRANTLAHRPATEPETLPAIFGPAILFHERVWF